MRTAVIHYDELTKRTSVQLSVGETDQGLEILCEAIVIVLRGARKRGDQVPDTQGRLDNIKRMIWNGILEQYDNPDVTEIQPPPNTPMDPTRPVIPPFR